MSNGLVIRLDPRSLAVIAEVASASIFLTIPVHVDMYRVYFPLHPLRPHFRRARQKIGADNKLGYFHTIVGSFDLKKSIGICYENSKPA